MEKRTKETWMRMGIGNHMIDISRKDSVNRTAIARGEIILKKGTIAAIKENKTRKGDVLSIAQIAGIQSVKNTWSIIPLCHQIPIQYIEINFKCEKDRIIALCEVKANYKTGVEMEALIGATVTLLTIWDMVKYLEKDKNGQYPRTTIKDITVVKKTKTNF